ncbi:MAG TPA: uracil-DNA glycosylase family protein [Isosphaeraceae bacterium]|nr:uracil-DNA glycosylase family protein [Isosphaeraceae bacterium]
MTANIDRLLAAVRREAERAEFPIDEPVYRRSGRDPRDPILFAGSLEAPVCIVGRDLGKDEVAAGQPLIGAAGRLVRLGLIEAWNPGRAASPAAPGTPPLQEALQYALLTNTVPYKPPGNKAYPQGVRQRFRTFLQELLARYWKGDQVITLGTEAFQWFAPYGDAAAFQSIGTTEARFETAFPCQLPASESPKMPAKSLVLYPLPHPSPLNQRWFGRFPAMLAQRLAAIRHHHPSSGP